MRKTSKIEMKKLRITTIAFIALYVILTAGLSSCNGGFAETENEVLKDGYFEHKDGAWFSMSYKIEERFAAMRSLVLRLRQGCDIGAVMYQYFLNF